MELQLEGIGSQCRKLRQNMNISQAGLAKEIEVSQQLVSKFENGRCSSLKLYRYYCVRFNQGKLI